MSLKSVPDDRNTVARSAVRLLREHIAPYRTHVMMLLALQMAQAVAALCLPLLGAAVIDDGVLTGDKGEAVRLAGLMTVVAAVQIVCAVGTVRLGAHVAMGIGRDLRNLLFDRVLAFSARETGTFGVATLITRTTNDVQQVQTLLQITGTLVVAVPITCVGGVILAVGQDTGLSALLLVLVPVLTTLAAGVLRGMRPHSRAVQECVDRVNRLLREHIAGVRVVRGFIREEYERLRFEEANTDLADASLRAGRLSVLMLPLGSTIVNLFSVLLVAISAPRILDGALPIGALTAFLGYLTLILTSVLASTSLFGVLPRAEVSAGRIVEVLETEPSVPPPRAPVTVQPRPGHIDVRDVTFRYPGAETPVLRGVDVVARPGEVTAIVGPTGSGKSTLLALLCRLMVPSGGQLSVGGVEVAKLDPAELSRSVGLVPQRPYLFSGTVASNLRYGRREATTAELWRALEIAQARDFVADLEGGLEAPVTQGGANFSGGQRQRLAIARSLVHRPDCYLFDDCFSALDHATDAALRSALALEISSATVVVVAQRIDTIRHARRIVVLDGGRVVATGVHDELLETCPTYREIALSQPATETT